MSVIETGMVNLQENDEGETSHVNNYIIFNILGKGAFSKVYLSKDTNGKEYALRILNKSYLKRQYAYKLVDGKMLLSDAFQKVQHEIAIMKKLAHSNLVKLHEVIDSPEDDKLFLVLELVRGGQVMQWDSKSFRYYKDSSSGVLEEEDVRRCIRDVASGLSYLHYNKICHRDIKPENILVGDNKEYKLTDFGVAQICDQDDNKMLRSTAGTYHFLAPECTTGKSYDPYQVDIWALGVTMYILLQGTLPFGSKASSLPELMKCIREKSLVFSPTLDEECVQLMKRMMEKDPSKRITLPELVSHPWLLSHTKSSNDATHKGPIVRVSSQEIKEAFTPINSFMLMVR